jgi:hypothetical protein
MKKLLGTDTVGSYTFNPGAKTVTFSNLQQDLTLANILLITNTTANTIIYNFADPTTGAISFNNNILTLDYDTSSMNSSDILQIYVDVESYEESLHTLLRRMNKILESNSVVDLQQRQRITIDALRTSATATTDLTGTIPVSGTVTASASGTYTVNNSITNQLLPGSASNPYTLSPASAAGIIMEGPVHQIWRIIDDSRSLYSNAIRSKLTFS